MYFVLGFSIGGMFGFLLAAVFAAGKRADEALKETTHES